MVASSKRFVRVFALLSILVFVGSLFLAAQPETTGNSLEALISGTTSDSAAVLSTLKDEDLPLALSAAEVLKFKSLHGDEKVTVQDAEGFKAAVEQKIKTARTVSLDKTETCTVPVPQRKATIGGQEIIIPAHFRAPEPLQIVEAKPEGEAGTIFPEIRIAYVSDSMPVSARFLLDDKPVEVFAGKGKTFVYRPELAVNTMLSIGTHTASVTLSDTKGRQASASWAFTVGVKPAPIPTPPVDAKVIATLSVPVGTLFPGTSSNEVVTVTVRQGSDGQRFFEYSITRKGVSYSTSSLYLLASTMKAGSRARGITFTPLVETMFPNVPMTFSYAYDGPGTVLSHTWIFTGFASTSDPQGTTASVVTSDKLSYVGCRLMVRTPLPENDPPYLDQEIYAAKGIYPIKVSPTPDSTRTWVAFRTAKTPASISCKRAVQSHSSTVPEFGGYFVEGETLPWGDVGKLTVNRARWRPVGTNEAISIENAAATQTRVLFGEPSVAELDHDISMTLTWGDERYDWTYQPATSSLVAALDFRANTIFKRFPPGIIANTERKIVAEKFEVVINGEKRVFASQADLTISPPWVLARPQVYPNSPPITLSKLYPVFVTTQPKVALTALKNFEASLKYDGATYPNSAIPLRMYFYNIWSSKAPEIDPDAIQELLPCSEWLTVKTFPTPAELLHVEMKTPSEGVFDGQETDIPITITPLPGMGTGQISNIGGTLNLLDGYESQNIDNFTWAAKLQSAQTNGKVRIGGLEIKFLPAQGAGTYAVVASTTLTIKEMDTGTIGKTTGVGTTTIPVQPAIFFLKTIDFSNDPNSIRLKKNPVLGSIWSDSSIDYEIPECIIGGRSNPIGHIKNTKIIATVRVQFEVPGIKFSIYGDGKNKYVTFKKAGLISNGNDQEIIIEAEDKLPDQICCLNESIQWRIEIGSSSVSAPLTSDHRIYATYGRPIASDPTEQRISWSCTVCTDKISPEPEDIVLSANDYLNNNTPPKFSGGTDELPTNTTTIWLLLDPNHPGGSCIAFSNLLMHVSGSLGITGGALVRVYASTDSNFDASETITIKNRICQPVVFIHDSPNTGSSNFFEGCFEFKNLYYPGAWPQPPFNSKAELHKKYVGDFNRLIYRTIDTDNPEDVRFYDKNFVEYDNPLEISRDDCIPVP